MDFKFQFLCIYYSLHSGNSINTNRSYPKFSFRIVQKLPVTPNNCHNSAKHDREQTAYTDWP